MKNSDNFQTLTLLIWLHQLY